MKQTAPSRSRRFLVLLVATLTTSLGGLATAPASAGASPCTPKRVPAPSTGVPEASLFGVLCLPSPSARPATAQLLVHGGTYNHQYWDWPVRPEQYSYVRRALAAGHAVMNVDRLGYGQSTRPLSTLVTLEKGAAALHDVVTRLRSGNIAGFPIRNVVLVGHSVGTIVGWMEASTYQDLTAFVGTGMTHHLKRTAVGTISQVFYPARLDPAYRDSTLDPGYLTTKPDTRGGFFYSSRHAEADVIAFDEQTKDTLAEAEAHESLSLILSPPPQTAPSRGIHVPTLVVVGTDDGPFCGAPDGLDCHDPAAVLRAEAPYYTPRARLEVVTIPHNGHNLQLHRSAALASDRIIDWIRQEVGET